VNADGDALEARHVSSPLRAVATAAAELHRGMVIRERVRGWLLSSKGELLKSRKLRERL